MRIMPAVLHAPWCDPARHGDAGDRDQHCRSTVWEYETLASAPLDRDAITISVERYAVRDQADADTWTEQTPTIYIETARHGVDLLPHEAVLVAQRILAAHAIADGTAVSW